MSFHVTRAMLDRPKQTIHAAELFHSAAAVIARACEEASPREVVVAVVDWEDMIFTGCHIVPTAELQVRVPDLEGRGYALIVAPGTRRAEIEERALEMAHLAFRRWEALTRWTSRHA
ncbi:MAG TPA: hypothetical protein VFB58_06265 [Chloroflexota bacterium]|nr:hypothetical protein [Chloroflexota bacterium]